MNKDEKLLACPYCWHHILTDAQDGELLLCSFCLEFSEVHDNFYLDLNANRKCPIRLLEPVN